MTTLTFRANLYDKTLEPAIDAEPETVAVGETVKLRLLDVGVTAEQANAPTEPEDGSWEGTEAIDQIRRAAIIGMRGDPDDIRVEDGILYFGDWEYGEVDLAKSTGTWSAKAKTNLIFDPGTTIATNSTWTKERYFGEDRPSFRIRLVGGMGGDVAMYPFPGEAPEFYEETIGQGTSSETALCCNLDLATKQAYAMFGAPWSTGTSARGVRLYVERPLESGNATLYASCIVKLMAWQQRSPTMDDLPPPLPPGAAPVPVPPWRAL